MAVASAGPYASLHLAPDRQPRQHPTAQFFTGRMPFLPPNQQRQSTEGHTIFKDKIIYIYLLPITYTSVMPPGPLYLHTQQCYRNSFIIITSILII